MARTAVLMGRHESEPAEEIPVQVSQAAALVACLVYSVHVRKESIMAAIAQSPSPPQFVVRLSSISLNRRGKEP